MDLLELENTSGPRHPWETVRSGFFRGLLASSVGTGRRFLDVGAGDAWLARQLVEGGVAGHVTCWDRGYSPALLARHALVPSPKLAYATERPQGRFEVLLLLDVLEHVEDDAGLLADLVDRNLEPGGHALLSVPAWPALYSGHDAALLHLRRYRPGVLRTLATGTGLRILASGGLFHTLLVPRALTVLRERAAPRRGPPRANLGVAAWGAPAPVTALVRLALSADTAVTRALLPFGLSLPGLSTWVLCAKPPRS